MNRMLQSCGQAAACLLVTLALAAPVRAATINVPGDQPTITAAIIAAAASGDTINIAAGVYTEALTVTKSVIIQGQGAGVTIVQAASAAGTATVRVVTLTGMNAVTIRNLTVRNGRVVGDSGLAAMGGGIRSDVNLTLEGVEVTQNQVTCTTGATSCALASGGGIAATTGTLLMINSAVVGNAATPPTCSPCMTGGVQGGGLFTQVNTTVIGCAFTGNSAQVSASSGTAGYGGGIHIGGGNFSLLNTTISGNTAYTRGAGICQWSGASARIESATVTGNANTLAMSGAGVFVEQPYVRLRNTIVARNEAPGTPANVDLDAYAVMGTSWASGGYNYLGNTPTNGWCVSGYGPDMEICVSTGNQITGGDPLLGALGDNGGPTQTHALLAGSPAIGAGACTMSDGTALLTDQRGFFRGTTVCSIGAYEAEPFGTALVVSTAEPTGANCAAGGLMVQTGSDYNGNGAFDVGEPATTSYVCNGATGHDSLILVTDEGAGASCAHGGKKIQTGLDLNDNGVLDAGEVTGTSYVCDGNPGANGASGSAGETSLIDVTDEPAGANCPTGGMRIQAGVDTNGNGTLDASEVTATSYVCNGATGPDGQDGVDGKAGGCAAGGGAAGIGALLPLLALALRRRRRG